MSRCFLLLFFCFTLFCFCNEVQGESIYDEETVVIRAYVAPDNSVNFIGKACPHCQVFLLRSGYQVANIVADNSGNFQLTEKSIISGKYLYNLYALDGEGRQTSLSSYYVTIPANQGTLMLFSNILVSPTFSINKSKLEKGEKISFFGLTVPFADVEISLDDGDISYMGIKADKDGFFYYQTDVIGLLIGNHKAEARSFLSDSTSSFSQAIDFEVIKEEDKKEVIFDKDKDEDEKGEKDQYYSNRDKFDLNGDNKVGLVDFSILLFWYEKRNFPKKVDLNSDGKINLIDFSILIYYWS